MKSLFVLLLAIAFVNSQLIESLIVDDFSVGSDSQQVVITLSTDLELGGTPIIESSSFNEPGCSGLIGCSRDMIVEVNAGFQSRSFTSNIFGVQDNTDFQGEWSISSPKTSASSYTLQYDGNDASSGLSPNGLGGLDLTDGGLTSEFRLSIILDLDSTFTITVYSLDGSSCESTLSVDGTPSAYNDEDTFFPFAFSSFSGNCDFENVGAIEVFLPSNDALDAIVRRISTFGDAPPSPSSTPSPDPTASNTPTRPPTASNTPTRPPSASQTTAPSASTTPLPPAFTWYTFDDDDNGRSSCNEERPRPSYFVRDDNVIYYYFFQSSTSSSPASIITVGFTLLACVLVALI